MSTAATSRYPTSNAKESIPLQFSEEELGKLQEIHELINLMFRELSVSPQNTAEPYFTAKLPFSPYTHTFVPWRMSPYMTPPGF